MVATRVVLYFSGVAALLVALEAFQVAYVFTGAMSAHRATTSEHSTTNMLVSLSTKRKTVCRQQLRRITENERKRPWAMNGVTRN